MARLKTIDPAAANEKATALLHAARAQLGGLPNMTRVMANAPAVLEGYLGLAGALARGVLPARLREQIALVVSEANRCDYCLSAHWAVGRRLGLSADELAAARRGGGEAKTAAALRFALLVNNARGDVAPADLEAVRAAGYSDEEITEILAHVALNAMTNYFNKAAGVEVDYPRIRAGEEAAQQNQ